MPEEGGLAPCPGTVMYRLRTGRDDHGSCAASSIQRRSWRRCHDLQWRSRRHAARDRRARTGRAFGDVALRTALATARSIGVPALKAATIRSEVVLFFDAKASLPL